MQLLATGEVVIVIAPTSLGCLALPLIAQLASDAAGGTAPAAAVRVEVDREFVWAPGAMSPAARSRKLEREAAMVDLLGITPARMRATASDSVANDGAPVRQRGRDAESQGENVV